MLIYFLRRIMLLHTLVVLCTVAVVKVGVFADHKPAATVQVLSSDPTPELLTSTATEAVYLPQAASPTLMLGKQVSTRAALSSGLVSWAKN